MDPFRGKGVEFLLEEGLSFRCGSWEGGAGEVCRSAGLKVRPTSLSFAWQEITDVCRCHVDGATVA